MPLRTTKISSFSRAVILRAAPRSSLSWFSMTAWRDFPLALVVVCLAIVFVWRAIQDRMWLRDSELKQAVDSIAMPSSENSEKTYAPRDK